MAKIREQNTNGKPISYRFSAYLGKGPDGKPIRRSTTWTPPTDLTPAKAQKAAQIAAALWEDELKQNLLPSGDSVTLSEAIGAYIRLRQNVLSPSTIRGYETIWKYRFPQYKDTPINQINWQQAVNEEAGSVSPKTLKNTWGFIRSVLQENDITVTGIRLPAIPKPEKPWLTPEQIPAFLRAVHGKPCEIPALLALCSLRLSEINGLLWENIDLKHDVIHVRGALIIGKDNQYIRRDANKTALSTRDVPIMIPQLHDALEAERKKSGRVMTCDPSTPYKQIRSVCKELGIPNVGVHGLRHSFASLAYHVGLSEMQTMRIGGWSDYGTMRKIYTHMSENDAIQGKNQMKQFYSASTY